MGNQQATDFDIGWLIGAIDGEGCVGVTRRNRKAKLGFTLKPHVQISNCDKAFIDRCTTTMTALDIPFHVSHYEGKGRRKASWQITVSGLKRVAKILPVLKGKLVGDKAAKADLVAEFVESRLADWHAAPFTARQLSIVELLYAMNTRGRRTNPSLNDYTRINRSSKYPTAKDIVYS